MCSTAECRRPEGKGRGEEFHMVLADDKIGTTIIDSKGSSVK